MSAVRFQITLNCADLERMSAFWAVALNYRPEPPPSGYDSWSAYGRAHHIPPDQWRLALIDPAGHGPRLFLQPAPEPKVGRNRVHLDLEIGADVPDLDERRRRIDEHVRRCVSAGATVLRNSAEPPLVVLTDPEGNEFCIQ